MSQITKEVKNQIEKRRTFAIISHPDAGKTTLTEKFLLYGGAINQAGSVKGKATAKHAVSDWMEIEKERGISVTSSVLQFNYDGYCINILDTPGHQDFSEDTYRTLMAADSAVMVIDASKGVEAQTRKLFKVCAMRHIPIFTFINKMDRAMDIFELLDDIETELGIATCPINWPIGSGQRFKGVYDRQTQEIELFSDTKKGTTQGQVKKIPLDSEEAVALIDEDQRMQLLEEIELQDGAGAEFDQELVSKGELHKTLEALQAILPEDKEAKMNVNDTLSLSLKITGATSAGVVFSSTNIEVAKVNEQGVVTAIAPGHATIIATTSNGLVKDMLDEIVKNNEPHLALFALDNGLYNYKKIVSFLFFINYFSVKRKGISALYENINEFACVGVVGIKENYLVALVSSTENVGIIFASAVTENPLNSSLESFVLSRSYLVLCFEKSVKSLTLYLVGYLILSLCRGSSLSR